MNTNFFGVLCGLGTWRCCVNRAVNWDLTVLFKTAAKSDGHVVCGAEVKTGSLHHRVPVSSRFIMTAGHQIAAMVRTWWENTS